MFWPEQNNMNNKLDQTSQRFSVTVMTFLTKWYMSLVSIRATADSRKNVVSSHSQETWRDRSLFTRK
ncbi:hypothetical protein PHET_12393 [Paragonimus heterotremus]|uniref:Uncharacterized protein n=1 Tax=Paragonimus heterotremus TaxID=100268 RepID=A0A8J4SJ68_9TREM|nr:hypothetical protein PHET_12393 [Paragonimus heterotremus]